MMKYFAYGSCLNVKSFKETLREENCKFTLIGTGRLENYRLAFSRKSYYGGGVLDIIPSEGDYVSGVIYEIAEEGFSALDRREGVGIGCYRRKEIEVDFEGEKIFSITYEVVEKSSVEYYPSESYLERVLNGMKEHNFPEDYIKDYLTSRIVCQECNENYAEGPMPSDDLRPVPVYVCSHCAYYYRTPEIKDFPVFHFRNQMGSWFFVFINEKTLKPFIYTFDYKRKRKSLHPWTIVSCPYPGEHDYNGFVSLIFPYKKKEISKKIPEFSSKNMEFYDRRLFYFQTGDGKWYSLFIDHDHFCPGAIQEKEIGNAFDGQIKSPFKIDWSSVKNYIKEGNKRYYFSYGADMDSETFAERYGKSLQSIRAVLFDYKPSFSKFSKKWDGGVLDLKSEPGECIEGICYEVDDEMLKNMPWFKITEETLEKLKDKVNAEKLEFLTDKSFPQEELQEKLRDKAFPEKKLIEKLTELNFNKKGIELVLKYAISQNVPEEEWKEPASKNSEIAKKIIKFEEIENLKSEYNKLTEIRNDVNHGGFLSKCRNYKKIYSSINTIFKAVKKKIIFS